MIHLFINRGKRLKVFSLITWVQHSTWKPGHCFWQGALHFTLWSSMQQLFRNIYPQMEFRRAQSKCLCSGRLGARLVNIRMLYCSIWSLHFPEDWFKFEEEKKRLYTGTSGSIIMHLVPEKCIGLGWHLLRKSTIFQEIFHSPIYWQQKQHTMIKPKVLRWGS